jgi:hypothetical protein
LPASFVEGVSHAAPPLRLWHRYRVKPDSVLVYVVRMKPPAPNASAPSATMRIALVLVLVMAQLAGGGLVFHWSPSAAQPAQPQSARLEAVASHSCCDKHQRTATTTNERTSPTRGDGFGRRAGHTHEHCVASLPRTVAPTTVHFNLQPAYKVTVPIAASVQSLLDALAANAAAGAHPVVANYAAAPPPLVPIYLQKLSMLL